MEFHFKTIQMLISRVTWMLMDSRIRFVAATAAVVCVFFSLYALFHFNFSPRNFALININVNAYHRRRENASAFIFNHLTRYPVLDRGRQKKQHCAQTVKKKWR